MLRQKIERRDGLQTKVSRYGGGKGEGKERGRRGKGEGKEGERFDTWVVHMNTPS